jgi:O-antigen ligase
VKKRGNAKSVASSPGKAYSPRVPAVSSHETLFLLAAGIWIGLSVVKFGNPVIFGAMLTPPANLAEFIFVAWPIGWGYILLALVVLASLGIAKPAFRKEHWPIGLLVIWLFWQLLSSARSIDKQLSTPTLIHFIGCVVALLLGYWALARTRVGGAFWGPVLAGLFYVLFSGFDQHHGGLDAVRKDFYANPNWQMYPKEYIAKIESNRIFSTFVYPNALAGSLLLLLPVSLWKLWELTVRWPRVVRGVVFGLYGYLGLGCLYWSGSKGGWLIALGMIAVGLLHLPFSPKVKGALVIGGVALGLTAFFVRYSAYFERGATSVSARFTYWSAALQTARDHPILGTGPGTFAVAYRKIKPADAEMARLAHNDYLEQASDSGIVGGLTFAGFVFGSLALLYRRAASRGWGFLLLWIGLLGWAAQAAIEFTLYIPALSWPVFLFFGWFWGLKEKDGAEALN